MMARPRKYSTPYTGDMLQRQRDFEEYILCVADCFGAPYDDREEAVEQRNNSLRSVCEEFNISIPKARKLLITAGVYSTKQSRRVAALAEEGKNVGEIMELTGLSRSSISSYLPYQKFSYNMEETSRHAEDSRKYRERKKTVEELWEKIRAYVDTGRTGKTGVAVDTNSRKLEAGAEADAALWQTVIAYQNYPFHTSSGLSFFYTVKQGKNGAYTGELVVSRKEGSKTLTRSSVLLAFHKVLESLKISEIDTGGERNTDGENTDGERNTGDAAPTVDLAPAEYKGPKAIGQIFGISYLYSFFWKWGLITVPEKIEEQLQGKRK
jgi:hypothetical protein